MKTLIINAHPDYANQNHVSVELAKYAHSLVPNAEILELYNSYIPRIDTDMMSAWSGEKSQKNESILARQNELLEQFLNADAVLIFMPLHNFSVTSALKDYFDNILIAGKTFKYTSGGSVGLLDNSKKVAFIQVSGSKYTSDIKYVNLDIAPHYVRSIFGLMGISELEVIRVQGLSLSSTDKVEVVNKAKNDIKHTLKEFKAL